MIVTIRIRNGFETKNKVSESMSKLMSELEKNRIKIVLDYLNENDNISSATAAVLLDVHVKMVSRLLKQAEKVGLLVSEGKTRDKIYIIK